MLRRRTIVLAGMAVFAVGVAAFLFAGTTIVDTEEDLWPDPRDRQAVHLGGLSQRLQIYYRDHGTLPPTLEAFGDSASRTDLWGRATEYVPRDSTFTLRSGGPDRILGTVDDVVLEAGTTYQSKRALYDRDQAKVVKPPSRPPNDR